MAEQAKSMVAGPGHNSYEMTRFNAVKHSILSRYTVLPWEDESEYGELLDALIGEHEPEGPTETHLVEEIAGIIWRKRRLRLAEGAAYREGLREAIAPYRHVTEAALAHLDAGKPTEQPIEAIRATPEKTQEDMRDLDQDQAMTERALKLLRAGKADAYEKALTTLRPDTQQAWGDQLEWEPDDYDENQEHYTADDASLQRYLEAEVRPWYETRRKELANRPLIQTQAFGEALDPNRLDKLARYEAHLDRKLERTLTMLLRLQELRSQSQAA